MKAFQAKSSKLGKSNSSYTNDHKDLENLNTTKDYLHIYIDLGEKEEENSIKKINLKKRSKIVLKCRWSIEEEKKLFNLITKKKKDWDCIASNFPDKSKEQCYTKYSKLITNFKKGKWTEEEDKLVIELANKFNFKWKLVASDYKHRSLTQIKQRYYNCLDPAINRGIFSEEEDLLLMEKFKIHGADWKKISDFFLNRPSNLIKNRFYTKIRNAQKGIY